MMYNRSHVQMSSIQVDECVKSACIHIFSLRDTLHKGTICSYMCIWNGVFEARK